MATRQALTKYVISGSRPTAGALIAICSIGLALCAQLAGGNATILAGLAFFAVGLAHGAGDENGGRIAPFSALHICAYVITGAALTALVLIMPIAGLTVFLIISAWHFARSEIPAHRLSRFAIACLLIGGSALFKGDETSQIFARILGLISMPQMFMIAAAIIGAVGVVASVHVAILTCRGWALVCVSLSAVILLEPVLAVGLLFFIAHALPLQSRQINTYGIHDVLRSVGWTTGVAIIGGGTGCWAVWSGILELPVAAALALGMAAPHMLTEQLER